MFYFCATRFMGCVAATACTNSFVLQWVVGTRNSGQGRARQGRAGCPFLLLLSHRRQMPFQAFWTGDFSEVAEALNHFPKPEWDTAPGCVN